MESTLVYIHLSLLLALKTDSRTPTAMKDPYSPICLLCSELDWTSELSFLLYFSFLGPFRKTSTEKFLNTAHALMKSQQRLAWIRSRILRCMSKVCQCLSTLGDLSVDCVPCTQCTMVFGVCVCVCVCVCDNHMILAAFRMLLMVNCTACA